MILVGLGILSRILSNSYLNVFQKKLTNLGYRSSFVNFVTYLGLVLVSLFFLPIMKFSFSMELLKTFLIMGFLGALGNYFIIKALSLGELSSLAPINSYKSIVAMIIAYFQLNEIPTISCLFGILLIILGTFLLQNISFKANKLAVVYRFIALIFSGAEAVYIKKIILLTDVLTSFFLWALAGLVFASILFMQILVKKENNNISIKSSIINFLSLILMVGVMQYSTNYVFQKINVSSALALFQLSILLSVFLGAIHFNEENLLKKIIAALIMMSGAIIIIIY